MDRARNSIGVQTSGVSASCSEMDVHTLSHTCKPPPRRAYRGFLRKGPVTGYGGIGSSLKVLKVLRAWPESRNIRVGGFGVGG